MAADAPKPVISHKLVLLGETSVGKRCEAGRRWRHMHSAAILALTPSGCRAPTLLARSCLCVRFCRGEFFDYQEPTIGAAFLTQTIQLPDCVMRMEIWDTAGQERYRSLAPMYYRGAAAAVVVFDVTSEASFTGAKTWVGELRRRADAGIVIALAGNKADVKEGRRVSAEVRDRV